MARERERHDIIVEDLCYRYPGTSQDLEALHKINLRLEQGKIYAVLGRNGSGKSTLARCLNGILLPTSGRVLSCGMDTSDPGRSRDIRKQVAMVFQDPETQIIGATVEEEVAFGPENLGLESGTIRERVDMALELTSLSHLRRRQPLRLSQGQKQLVAIAGALAMQPAFLISDESTSMLDYHSRSGILKLYSSLKESGMGVIHVTHFLEEAVLADEVLILDDGRLLTKCRPVDILCEPDRVRSMGLDPLPVTLVTGELNTMGLDTPQGILTVEEMLSWLTA